MKVSKLEIKIIQQLHLQGFWGKSGNLTVAQRRAYLKGLMEKGLIDKYCRVTDKGHDAVLNNH